MYNLALNRVILIPKKELEYLLYGLLGSSIHLISTILNDSFKEVFISPPQSEATYSFFLSSIGNTTRFVTTILIHQWLRYENIQVTQEKIYQ